VARNRFTQLGQRITAEAAKESGMAQFRREHAERTGHPLPARPAPAVGPSATQFARIVPEPASELPLAQRIVAQAAREGITLRLTPDRNLHVDAGSWVNGCPRPMSIHLSAAISNHGHEIVGWLRAQEAALGPDEEYV
jgi:hypothetical protein